MFHEILADGTWYKVTNPNTFDCWGQKCFRADASMCTVSSNDNTKTEWFDFENPTYIPASTIQKIKIIQQ